MFLYQRVFTFVALMTGLGTITIGTITLNAVYGILPTETPVDSTCDFIVSTLKAYSSCVSLLHSLDMSLLCHCTLL